VTVEVAVFYGNGRPRMPKRTIADIVATVLRGEKAKGGKISCILVGDAAIRKINTKYLGHRSVTDVISFPIETRPFPEAELYVNVQQARRQARAYRVSVRNELTRLLVHGLLHVLGYDDKRTNQRKKMFEVQERYVRLCMRKTSR